MQALDDIKRLTNENENLKKVTLDYSQVMTENKKYFEEKQQILRLTNEKEEQIKILAVENKEILRLNNDKEDQNKKLAEKQKKAI